MIIPDLLETGGGDFSSRALLKVPQIRDHIELLARPQHQIHPFEGRNLFRAQLGITPNDHHESRGIGPDGPANGIAAALVTRVGDRTSIDDIKISLLLKSHPLKSYLLQGAGDGRAL